MSLLDKIFKKKKRSDELARRGVPKDRLPTKKDEEQKDLTLSELEQKQQPAPKVAKEKKSDTRDAYRILIKPLVTEKGTYLHATNQYLFEVSPTANKIRIKKAIWHLYGVKPIKVNIIKVKGKKVKYGRTSGQTKNRKKAIVTLKSGEIIKVYEGV